MSKNKEEEKQRKLDSKYTSNKQHDKPKQKKWALNYE